MMVNQVKNLTHQMRLFGIHEACERRASEALAEQLHSLEFLRLLLEDEALSRKQRITGLPKMKKSKHPSSISKPCGASGKSSRPVKTGLAPATEIGPQTHAPPEIRAAQQLLARIAARLAIERKANEQPRTSNSDPPIDYS